MAVLKTTSPTPVTSAPSAPPTKARPSSRTSAARLLSSAHDHRLGDPLLLPRQGPRVDRPTLQLHDLRRQTPRQVVAFGHDPDQDEVAGAVVALHDLVRDARERSADLVRVHNRRLEPPLGDAHERSRSRSAIRMYSPLRAWRK